MHPDGLQIALHDVFEGGHAGVGIFHAELGHGEFVGGFFGAGFLVGAGEVRFERGGGGLVFALLQLGVAQEEDGFVQRGILVEGGDAAGDFSEAGFGGFVIAGQVGGLAAAEGDAEAFLLAGLGSVGGGFSREARTASALSYWPSIRMLSPLSRRAWRMRGLRCCGGGFGDDGIAELQAVVEVAHAVEGGAFVIIGFEDVRRVRVGGRGRLRVF